MSGRLLDRRFRAIDAALLGSRAPMARQLADLRKVAAQIDPARLKLGGRARRTTRSARAGPLLRAVRRRAAAPAGDPRPAQRGPLPARAGQRRDRATKQASLGRGDGDAAAYACLAARIDEQLRPASTRSRRTDPARADGLRRRRPGGRSAAPPGDPDPAGHRDAGLAALRIVRGEQRRGDPGRGLGNLDDDGRHADGGDDRPGGGEPANRARPARRRRSWPRSTMADQAAALEAGRHGPGRCGWPLLQAGMGRGLRRARPGRRAEGPGAPNDRRRRPRADRPKPGVPDRR